MKHKNKNQGFRTFRKIKDQSKKRSMNCDEATAQAYGWELDVAPQIIAKSGRALPSLPDVAKNALPAQGAPAEIGPQEAMPEVVKPTTKPRTTKK